MNSNQMQNRKAALTISLSSGKDLNHSIAPGEFLALVAHTDPLNFERGLCMLKDQIKADDGEFFKYQYENECYAAALNAARNTFFMDSIRLEINKYKYMNGLLADDELLALALFLIADSIIVDESHDAGEVEFDVIANLVNHVANRLKFLVMCMRDGKYDILNTVIQFTCKYKTEDINTLFCFDTVTPDDGGVINYIRAMTDCESYGEYYDKLRKDHKTTCKDLGTEDDEIDTGYGEDYGEPLIDRDFEG